MIRYTIACSADHRFDAWFPSSAGADEQIARGLVSCPFCGATKVAKALMAPAVARAARAPEQATTRIGEGPTPAPATRPQAAAHAPRALMERLWAMRAKIEASAENVGSAFAREARAIHEGESDERPIYGDCTIEDARALIEDGVEIAPMPPARRDD